MIFPLDFCFFFTFLIVCCKCIQKTQIKYKWYLRNLSKQNHKTYKLFNRMFFIATRDCWCLEINLKTFIFELSFSKYLSIAALVFFAIIEFFLQWLICIAIVEQCLHSSDFENKLVRWSCRSSSRSCKSHL